MNRKILLTGLLLVAVLLATPFVGLAQAGKGQDKRAFVLYFEGIAVEGTEEKGWNTGPDPENPTTEHARGIDFIVTNDIYLEIGALTIGKPFLEYKATMDLNVIGQREGFEIINVRETISIYSSSSVHNEAHLRGTLEIQALGTFPDTTRNSFVGHGTGEFEGVKVQGVTPPLQIVVTGIPPYFYYLVLERQGIVMGWP